MKKPKSQYDQAELSQALIKIREEAKKQDQDIKVAMRKKSVQTTLNDQEASAFQLGKQRRHVRKDAVMVKAAINLLLKLDEEAEGVDHPEIVIRDRRTKEEKYQAEYALLANT